MDVLVARGADDERLASHFRHEGGPRGLARSRFPEFLEAGDLVDCHRGAGLAEFAFPFAEPFDQLLAGIGCRGRRGVADDRPPAKSVGAVGEREVVADSGVTNRTYYEPRPTRPGSA